MSEYQSNIPDVTIETLCRTFFKEAARYGFQQVDYVRFINLLLDLATNGDNGIVPEQQANLSADDDESRSNDASPLELPLKGAQIDIRLFDAEADLELLNRWVHDPYGRYFLLSRSISRHLDIHDVTDNQTNLIGMITLKGGQPIGAVAFLDYDPVQRKAELRKLIGDPTMRGKGFAKEASEMWVGYGLKGLGLKKIYLNTLNTHLRNIRLNEELGFKIEGILRNEVYFDGRYHDVLRMGMWRG